MSADVVAIAAAIVAGQGFLLVGVVLASGRDNALANALLALLIAVISVRIAVYPLLALGFSHPPLLGALSQPFFLGGPLLYLYVIALLEPPPRWHGRHLLHMLPALLSALATPWLYTPHHFTGGFPAAQDAATQQLQSLHKLFGIVCFATYVVHTLRFLQRRADAPAATLIWLRDLLAMSLLAALTAAGWSLHLLLGLQTDGPLAEASEFGGYALLFYLIATAGVRRHLRLGDELTAAQTAAIPPPEAVIAPTTPAPPDISPTREAPAAVTASTAPDENAEAGETRGKYARTSLSEARAQRLWARVTTYMEHSEPYLDSELSLAELAAAVDSYPRELSQVLNTVGGQNFYDFVNGYRATKARDLILAAEHRAAMVDIALAAGFTSRSTLYKHFVKCFAMTPSQFRKNCHSAAGAL